MLPEKILYPSTNGDRRRSWLSRLVGRRARLGTALVAAAAITGVAVAGGADPAHADNVRNRVTLSGSIYMLDDDWWPNPDDSGTHLFSTSVRVGGATFSKTFTTSGCVGGEVKGSLLVVVEDHNSGWVKIRARGRLYESTSCPNGDLDGDSGERVLWVAPNSSGTLKFRVDNGEPLDAGYNVYKLRVQNITPVP
jgi:hypothetical protein